MHEKFTHLNLFSYILDIKSGRLIRLLSSLITNDEYIPTNEFTIETFILKKGQLNKKEKPYPTTYCEYDVLRCGFLVKY